MNKNQLAQAIKHSKIVTDSSTVNILVTETNAGAGNDFKQGSFDTLVQSSMSGASAPTLQEVTDKGSTTTTNITAATYGAALVTDAELGYLDGVTSNIQVQLDTPFTFGTDITADFTLTIAEQNKYIDVDKATAVTVTVPKNTFSTGDTIILEQTGAGQVIVAPIDGDVTITGGLKTFDQYYIVQLVFKSANVVNIIGGTNV